MTNPLRENDLSLSSLTLNSDADVSSQFNFFSDEWNNSSININVLTGGIEIVASEGDILQNPMRENGLSSNLCGDVSSPNQLNNSSSPSSYFDGVDTKHPFEDFLIPLGENSPSQNSCGEVSSPLQYNFSPTRDSINFLGVDTGLSIEDTSTFPLPENRPSLNSCGAISSQSLCNSDACLSYVNPLVENKYDHPCGEVSSLNQLNCPTTVNSINSNRVVTRLSRRNTLPINDPQPSITHNSFSSYRVDTGLSKDGNLQSLLRKNDQSGNLCGEVRSQNWFSHSSAKDSDSDEETSTDEEDTDEEDSDIEEVNHSAQRRFTRSIAMYNKPGKKKINHNNTEKVRRKKLSCCYEGLGSALGVINMPRMKLLQHFVTVADKLEKEIAEKRKSVKQKKAVYDEMKYVDIEN